ncbi:hypothetical protein TNCV_1322251 [Trichonephila clavipes]|nr:hypothetical protein TNCV_1322251 [Trichonephila clavipes]
MSFNRACGLLEQLDRRCCTPVCHGCDEVIDQTLGNTAPLLKKCLSPSLLTVAGGLGRAAFRRPSMSQTCSIFQVREHAGHSYAVLFQLQACSPPNELYAVRHYYPG